MWYFFLSVRTTIGQSGFSRNTRYRNLRLDDTVVQNKKMMRAYVYVYLNALMLHLLHNWSNILHLLHNWSNILQRFTSRSYRSDILWRCDFACSTSLCFESCNATVCLHCLYVEVCYVTVVSIHLVWASCLMLV